MTMNPSKQEFSNYFYSYIKILSILVGVIFVVQIFSFLLFNSSKLDNFLFGNFIGVISASINIFCMGLVFYKLVILENSKIWLLLPVASFLVLCALVGFLVNYAHMIVLGFAVGLCVPLVFAFFITQAKNPLDPQV